MVVSVPIGIDMPDDFPTLAHNKVCSRLSAYQGHALWPECGAGWNAVAHRFFSAAKADESFTVSVTQGGVGPAPDERQMQEETLFVFFVAGHSAIESLTYALYAMGAMLQPEHFPMSLPGHLKTISPTLTQAKFAAHFAGSPVAVALATLLADTAYDQWCDIRNELAHRIAPSRHYKMTVTASTGGSAGTAEAGPTKWQVAGGLILDDQTTSGRRKWLASQLTACVQATEAFLPPDVSPAASQSPSPA